MPPSTQTTRLQSTLRLLIPRLRLLQKKENASSVAQRRELAQSLDNGREASARIRVENVIATDIAVEVMEMVELYCELLLARAAVLDQLAFAEHGIRARSKAREIMARKGLDAGAAPDAAAGRKRLLGFGFSPKSVKQGTRDHHADDVFGVRSEVNRGAIQEGDHLRGRDLIEERRERDDDVGGEEEEAAAAAAEANCYIDPVLDEAAAAIFYAWPRFPREVRELTTLRSLLIDRYGKDFALLAQDSNSGDHKAVAATAGIKIPERLVKRLRVRAPSKELVESYLSEIAKAYGVEWPKAKETAAEAAAPTTPDTYIRPEEKGPSLLLLDVDNNDKQSSSQLGNLPLTPSSNHTHYPNDSSTSHFTATATEIDPNRRTITPPSPPRDLIVIPRSPVSIAPPAPRSDNPNPRVKIPDDQNFNRDDLDQNNASFPSPPSPRAAGDNIGGAAQTTKKSIPEMDELARRFAALRR